MEETKTTIDEKLESHLAEMMATTGEYNRINSEVKLRKRLLDIERVYDNEVIIQEKALAEYNRHKITIVSLSQELSISRPTLYNDSILFRFVNFLIDKSKKNSLIEKAKRVSEDKQNAEAYNNALVDDVIELLHRQREIKHLKEENEYLRRQLQSLQGNGKSDILPLPKRKMDNGKNENGKIIRVDLHRD